MARRGGDVSKRALYALYDKDEQLIFTGDIDEFIQHTGCLRSTIYAAVFKHGKIIIKYDIVKKGNLYSLYDKDKKMIFTGTINQIVDRMGCNKTTVYDAVREGRKLSVKYKLERIGYEPVTEKQCYRCGKVLPVEKMVHYHRRSDGKYVPRTICYECKKEESREYRQRTYKPKKRSPKSIYYIYEGDKLIISGTCKEVADALFVNTSALYKCIYRKNKLLGMYRVERKKKGE